MVFRTFKPEHGFPSGFSLATLVGDLLCCWTKLEPIIQSEVSQKDKDHYSILTHIYGIYKDGKNNPICKTEKETQMYISLFSMSVSQFLFVCKFICVIF